jgi:hypothetical protein
MVRWSEGGMSRRHLGSDPLSAVTLTIRRTGRKPRPGHLLGYWARANAEPKGRWLSEAL